MYFTTMNLPAPDYEKFREKYDRYRRDIASAVPDFEEELSNFFEVEATKTFTNCFTALSIALLYATKDRTDTVAIAALAYRRTTDIVLWSGLRPIYIDNEPETLGMCIKRLEDKLQQGNVGCVLVQHPMVNIIDPQAYVNVCEKYKVPVIFDSVEATGGKFEEKRIGGFGKVEGFSLHPSKVINAAEGGVLTFGRLDEYHNFMDYIDTIGLNRHKNGKIQFFGLEPLHAIMGLSSIEAYQKTRSDFRTHYQTYKQRLEGLEAYRLVEYDSRNEPNFKSVLVELTVHDNDYRENLIRFLENHCIGARPYYSPLHHMIANDTFPVAEKLSKHYVFLPIGHSVSTQDIELICDYMIEFHGTYLSGNGPVSA